MKEAWTPDKPMSQWTSDDFAEWDQWKEAERRRHKHLISELVKAALVVMLIVLHWLLIRNIE